MIRKVELSDKNKQLNEAKNMIKLLMKDADDPANDSPDQYVNNHQSDESDKESKSLRNPLVDENEQVIDQGVGQETYHEIVQKFEQENNHAVDDEIDEEIQKEFEEAEIL